MIYHGMSFGDYRAIKAINASAIKQGVKSMAAMQAELTRADDDGTDAMDWGKAVHSMLLEPHLDAVVCYEGTRRGKEWEAFKAANDGKTILKADAYHAARMSAFRALQNKTIARLVHSSATEAEMSLAWDVGADRHKARIDGYNALGILIDVKTSRDIDGRRFGKAFFDMGYDIQLAWYRRGLRAHGLPCNAVKVIAIESGDQPDAVVFAVPMAQLDKAEVKIEEILNRYALAVAQDRYPGKHDGAEEVPLCVPSWEEVEMDLTNGATMEASEL